MEVRLHCSKEDLVQNLRDAGCPEKVMKDFLDEIGEGKLPEGVHTLMKHRVTLLDNVHAEQKKIDCLDYLVYMLQKENITR